MLLKNEYQLLAKYRSAWKPPEPPESELFQAFIDRKLVRIADSCYEGAFPRNTWVVTSRGGQELSAYEEKLEQDAQTKRQKRFENKISVLNILIPLITFLLGITVEHFASVISKLLSLFH